MLSFLITPNTKTNFIREKIMSVFFVTGRPATGKSLLLASHARKELVNKCVVTNFDSYLDFFRVPAVPTAEDLQAKCLGLDGALFLDESLPFLKSLQANADFLKEFILFITLNRWDVYFVVQDIKMMNIGLFHTLADYLVTCDQSKSFLFSGFVGSVMDIHHCSIVAKWKCEVPKKTAKSDERNSA